MTYSRLYADGRPGEHQPHVAPHRALGPRPLGSRPRGRRRRLSILSTCAWPSEPDAALREYFAGHSPALIALSFRNVDDSFWPSMTSFLPQLVATVDELRRLSDAPLVLGGSGFSIFAAQIMERTRADFGIRGDGEEALESLLRHLEKPGSAELASVPGLLRWEDGGLQVEPAALAPAGGPCAATQPRARLWSTMRRTSAWGVSSGWRPSAAARGPAPSAPIRSPRECGLACAGPQRWPARPRRCSAKVSTSCTSAMRSSTCPWRTRGRCVRSSCAAASASACVGSPTPP